MDRVDVVGRRMLILSAPSHGFRKKASRLGSFLSVGLTSHYPATVDDYDATVVIRNLLSSKVVAVTVPLGIFESIDHRGIAVWGDGYDVTLYLLRGRSVFLQASDNQDSVSCHNQLTVGYVITVILIRPVYVQFLGGVIDIGYVAGCSSGKPCSTAYCLGVCCPLFRGLMMSRASDTLITSAVTLSLVLANGICGLSVDMLFL